MFHAYIPWLPPSANNIYRKGRGGKRFLSEEAKRFKTEVKTHLSRNYGPALKYFVKDEPYSLIVLFVFADEKMLFNKGWPQSAKTRYKKLDVSNRLKLLEDALVDATGCDDAQHWSVLIRKTVGEEDGLYVWAWNEDSDGDNPVLGAIRTAVSRSSQ
jgi:Holliday junction resolvase RusA-like endonuclease